MFTSSAYKNGGGDTIGLAAVGLAVVALSVHEVALEPLSLVFCRWSFQVVLMVHNVTEEVRRSPLTRFLGP